MNFKVNVKSMEDIIGRWVDTEHICNTLAYLENCTGEASRAYEKEKWIKKEVRIDEPSLALMRIFMADIAVDAEQLRLSAKEDLKTMLESAIINGEGDFEKYKDEDCHQYMNEIIEELYCSYGAIYDSRRDRQIENFYEALWKCLDKVKAAE